MVKIAGLCIAVFVAIASPALMSAEGVSPGVWAITAAFGLVLAVLSAIDIETLRLPDVLTLPLVPAGLFASWLLELDDVTWRAAAALAAFLLLFGLAEIFKRLRRRDALGLGDAKLFAASAAWVGFAGLPNILLIASLSALAAAAVAALSGRSISRETQIPFGPFLAGATWIVWLYGPNVVL